MAYLNEQDFDMMRIRDWNGTPCLEYENIEMEWEKRYSFRYHAMAVAGTQL